MNSPPDTTNSPRGAGDERDLTVQEMRWLIHQALTVRCTAATISSSEGST